MLYSSVVGVLGCSGRANFSAAHAMLDALSINRRIIGAVMLDRLQASLTDI